MVGGLSASADLDHRMRKVLRSTQAGLVRIAADRVDGLVFEKEKFIGGSGRVDLSRDDLFLQREGLFEPDPPQPLNLHIRCIAPTPRAADSLV